MSLRIPAEEKTVLLRAAALEHTDLTNFVRQHSLEAARAVIRRREQLHLSSRDSLRVLDLPENPPAPNATLRAAAKGTAKAQMTVPVWHEEPINKKHYRQLFDCGEKA
jgi:uncharacterized protein (DUF1778 family)